jgi:monovalent cation:H+ antiporter, CPA1 family
VAISLIGTAAIATFALGLSFRSALVLGALLAITDTVSVLLAFRAVRVPSRLAVIMEGESLFNDGTALVLVSTTAAIAAGEHAGALEVSRSLLIALLGGTLFGAVFGALGAATLRWTPDHLSAVLVSFVVVFGAALLSEQVHASPVIAVVIVALVLGRTARRTLPSSQVLALRSFWETMAFGLNVLVFLLAGMQLEIGMLISEASSIGLALVALHIGRALAVYGSFAILRALRRDKVPMRWQHVMVVGNIKGALSMAAVLALPAGVADKPRLIAIVFGVTLVTLLMQALPFKALLRALRVVSQDADVALEAARTKLVAARTGQVELDELLASGLVSRREHAERKSILQRQVLEAERNLRGAEIEGDGAQLDRAVLEAQRIALADAVRRGVLNADAVQAELAEIDEKILRIREREEAD